MTFVKDSHSKEAKNFSSNFKLKFIKRQLSSKGKHPEFATTGEDGAPFDASTFQVKTATKAKKNANIFAHSCCNQFYKNGNEIMRMPFV